MKKKIKFHREKIIHRNTQERERYITFFNQKCDYYFNFEFYIPIGYCSLKEYLFLKKAVRELSPLVRPEKLAEYLNVDVELIYEGIKEGLLPCFTDSRLYSIKTIAILPFVRKFL